ncbi:NLR family CARD domain-containing protein 4 [Holothuria leucospilota]|uniref:NLR family CARD domain-containing protein 4 n=1 Tax=Holothuria leucospilota TaxID=206669 RepID=A0A9Q1HKE7_HOLLE|nr:NLR family CARD domain-containing protein 4 [Holothuria leucospilota]
MELEVKTILILFLLVMLAKRLLFLESTQDARCDSPQYLELGKSGTIICVFHRDFVRVLWYNTTDYLHTNPILHYNGESIKSGLGYESGEFDIFPNGSLIISEVSLEHDHTFKVAYVPFEDSQPTLVDVEIIVLVKPSVPFPVFDSCDNVGARCYSSLQSSSSIQCLVHGARPKVTLILKKRTVDGDVILSNTTLISSEGIGYTARITTSDVFHRTSSIVLLICQASSPPGMLEKGETLMLTENGNTDLPREIMTKHIMRYSRMELNCSQTNKGFVAWKKAISVERVQYQLLLYSLFIEDSFTKVIADDFSLGSNSSLIVPSVDLKHEGIYICTFGDGVIEAVKAYKVTIAVSPVPPYPVVDGCAHHPYCALEAEREGTLTCTVHGIRPHVQLEWKTFYDSDAASISFTNQKMTVTDNGETFDVIYWTEYRVHLRTRVRLTVECKVSEDFFSGLSTKIDLVLLQDSVYATDKTNLPSSYMLPHLPSVLCIILLLLLLWGLNVCCKRFYKNRRPTSTFNSENNEESVAMLTSQPSGLQNIREIKDRFLKEVKEKYKELYDAVQPIPYVKDKMYCVDKVFVEGGIEFLESIEDAGRHELWKRLERHQDIFRASCVKSPRRILEGEPGYGKSTVTLQIAYDWCNSKTNSVLKDVEILILLRLRQLGGVPSIYRAIKRFILPMDTKLTERDIETILHSDFSVAVILDGFDEYPDRDSVTITDVTTIIARQKFQDAEVITTTRSSFLPKKYPPSTKRIRLTGFNAKARRYYIRKAVVGDDDEGVKTLEGYLEQNPILSDLCQVPLLFVIFAHMAKESEEFRKLNSVTKFFRYMISCFHSHMRNKMKDENVRNHELFETNHSKLDRAAFEALQGSSQKIVWPKDQLRQQIGREFYDQYIRIGILVEEEGFDFNNDPATPITEHVRYKTEVRFYHKLFCEWYAAHYLADYLQQNPDVDLRAFLQHLDPFDVQYMYRFSCGLNSESAKKIISYLKKIEGGDKFAILCILEQTGKIDNIKETIRQLCSTGLIISGHESLLLQRSSLQLLEIAARNDMHIDLVDLNNCLKSVDLSSKCIQLQSGLMFNSRIPTKELGISVTSREITKEEAIAVLEFSSMCPSLKKLVFRSLAVLQ